LKCELSIASFDSIPQYEALSYVWGNPADPKYIELDKQKFPVTHNLHATLRALRNNRTKRVLWVDALCINQADIPERIAQVAQMRHIYEAAQEVAVWLGGETSGSPRAFSFLK
ncbi:heterokaryon incompatibility, partial [Cryomyces antarcticus]